MSLFRVTASRVMQGYAKAAYVYEAGDIVDPEHMPEGHFERLREAGVLEPVDGKAPPAAGNED